MQDSRFLVRRRLQLGFLPNTRGFRIFATSVVVSDIKTIVAGLLVEAEGMKMEQRNSNLGSVLLGFAQLRRRWLFVELIGVKQVSWR